MFVFLGECVYVEKSYTENGPKSKTDLPLVSKILTHKSTSWSKNTFKKKISKNVFFWRFRPFPDFYFEKQGGLRKPRQVLRPSSKLAIGFFEICLRKRQKKIQILKKMTTSLFMGEKSHFWAKKW